MNLVKYLKRAQAGQNIKTMHFRIRENLMGKRRVTEEERSQVILTFESKSQQRIPGYTEKIHKTLNRPSEHKPIYILMISQK